MGRGSRTWLEGLPSIVRNRLLEARREADLRLVAEEFFGLRDVGVGMPHVARPRVVVNWVDISAEDVVKRVDEFVNRDAAAGADVERFASYVALGGEDIRLNGVVDEREVTGLLAVTVDDGALPVEHQRDELRDDRGVVAVGVLTRAEDVEVAERGRVDVVEVTRLECEFLRVVLRERIGGFWLFGHRLDFRELFCGAVHRGGRGDDDGVDARFAGSVDDGGCPGAVDVGGRDWVVDAARDG